MERPKRKDYATDKFTFAKGLYHYTQALNKYIDHLESTPTEESTSGEVKCPICWEKLEEIKCTNNKCLTNNGISEL